MSNKKNIYNNSSTEHSIKSTIYNVKDQVVNSSKRADLSSYNSQDFLNRIVEELCDLYNKEVMKENYNSSILYSIGQHMTNKQQKPEEIINLCLKNQSNPIIQNNYIIQHILGMCYRRGKWIKNDNHLAFINYQKSAELGNSNGMADVADMGDPFGIESLGKCYRDGIGVEKDINMALIYYRKLVEMGHAIGMNCLGYCYRNGIGVEKDEHKAFIYYQKSADMDNASGINYLGDCYLYGIGVVKDEHKASIYYLKSANMGNVSKIKKLGFWYLHGLGVEKDEYKSYIYYQKYANMTLIK
ncbi:calmodulin-dependent protein kinase [Gigaspora margarita]|uniref:Calmodulin-dependent protein kinase n=1 Tax=Gigaspora margarita TaxID=4874 RepID=A0A8H4AH99_GIGMA|nr:calmodulin-dependent protein kinase [Gigaspora margarita]